MPEHPTYVVDILGIGLGLGPTLVSVSITAMGDVREDVAGLGSGLMTTGNETAAALGVAALSAIASAVAMSGSFAIGHQAGQWAATLLAAALALVGLLAIPAVRMH